MKTNSEVQAEAQKRYPVDVFADESSQAMTRTHQLIFVDACKWAQEGPVEQKQDVRRIKVSNSPPNDEPVGGFHEACSVCGIGDANLVYDGMYFFRCDDCKAEYTSTLIDSITNFARTIVPPAPVDVTPKDLTRREYLAAVAMQGALASDYISKSFATNSSSVRLSEGIAKYAIAQADALIKQLDK